MRRAKRSWSWSAATWWRARVQAVKVEPAAGDMGCIISQAEGWKRLRGLAWMWFGLCGLRGKMGSFGNSCCRCSFPGPGSFCLAGVDEALVVARAVSMVLRFELYHGVGLDSEIRGGK